MDIASMLEVQVNEVKEADSKENVTPGDLVPSTTNTAPSVGLEMSSAFKLMFSNDIASVRFHRLHCTACDAHIGSAPSQAPNMSEHPVLRTLICAECRNFYGDGTFEQGKVFLVQRKAGDDATDMFCRWCANGGNLYCCSYCSNTFCYNCIRRNFDAIVVKRIEADEKWKCFVCNPTELSASRAICCALLQHVQTVTRILQNNRKMSPEEIEEKMNLDETQCCTRKRKRKWRKNCSPVVPLNNSRVKKPVMARRRSLNSGMFLRLVPVMSHSTSPQKDAVRQHNLSLPTLPCEQNSAESPSQVMNNLNATTVPMSSEQATPLKCDRPPLYNSPSMITAVPTASLLQNPPPHQVLISQSPAPMVAIPNQSASQLLNHPQKVVLRKSKKSTKMMVTPNIIDLDSDSDEPAAAEAPPVNNVIIDDDVDIVNVVPAPAVPVALVSNGHIHNGVYNCISDNTMTHVINNALTVPASKSTCGTSKSKCSASNNATNVVTREPSPFREMSTRIEEQAKPFSDILLPHTNEVESILKKLKQKFAKLSEAPRDKNVDARANKIARNLVMHFYRDICITVKELATINDRVIREYNSWKRIYEKEDHVQPVVNRRKRKRRNSTDTSLDMVCVNESDTESDSSGDVEDSIIIPSELIGATNALEDVLLFKKLNTVERGTGDWSILSNDKAVQVQTNEEPILPATDFEQGIGYTVLRKNNRKRGRKPSILQRSVSADDHTDKFEEQFIYYLQHIEDHGIDADDSEDPPESKEASLKEPLEANSPKLVDKVIMEALKNVDASTPKTSSETREIRQLRIEGNDVPDEIIVAEEVQSVVTASEDAPTTGEEFTTVVNKLTDNLDERAYEALNDSLRLDKDYSANREASLTLTKPTNVEDAKKSVSYLMDIDVEEDCTIIDD